MRYLMLMFAGWLVPGAGHFLGGRRGKGIFFLLAIGGTYAAGLWLTNYRTVRFDDNPFYYAGQWGCGAIAWVCHRALPPHRPPEDPLSWNDPGLLYICVAGLLNAVVVLNLLHLPLGTEGRNAFGQTVEPGTKSEVRSPGPDPAAGGKS